MKIKTTNKGKGQENFKVLANMNVDKSWQAGYGHKPRHPWLPSREMCETETIKIGYQANVFGSKFKQL